MTKKKTSISDEKVKEVLIDGINKGADYILNQTRFYDYIRTIHKIEYQRCIKLYKKLYPEAQRELNALKMKEGAGLAQEAVKRDILTKLEAQEILTKIARGNLSRQGLLPSDSERIAAIKTIATQEGWESPSKSEITIKDDIDYSKLSDRALDEIIKAKREN
ncbi:MAG: hypothetical protein KF862_07275 [Chitinophagaceae bacterium]|nr:hypothetical protein [Chitinophagaceae bacterium]